MSARASLDTQGSCATSTLMSATRTPVTMAARARTASMASPVFARRATRIRPAFQKSTSATATPAFTEDVMMASTDTAVTATRAGAVQTVT